MPERAEETFQTVLALDPRCVDAVNGLGMCAFEHVELGKAEEMFRRGTRLAANQVGEAMLARIDALRRIRQPPQRLEARRKFWQHWADTELIRLTDEQRRKRMAEVVARPRRRAH